MMPGSTLVLRRGRTEPSHGCKRWALAVSERASEPDSQVGIGSEERESCCLAGLERVECSLLVCLVAVESEAPISNLLLLSQAALGVRTGKGGLGRLS